MDAKALQVFSYKERGVRIVEIDGEPWFVAKDVCDILEIQNVSQAVENLDDDEKGISKTYTLNGMQDMTVISEPGVYALVMKSRKPEAKQFSRWVRHEVLPSIRKTGSYLVQPDQRIMAGLDIEKAKILQHMIDSPAYPLTDESKAVIAHEVFKLITGHENPAMLPAVKEAMYSATEIGQRLNVSKNKIGKIAKAHGLKPPIGETNEYGTWIRTKSPYSSHECPQFMYNDYALDWFSEHSDLLH